MLKKNRPCPRGQLLAFTIRSMGVWCRYSIYLHIFHLIPLFESRETALNGSRLLRASYFPISSIFLYTSIITVRLDGVGESYPDCHGDSRGWRRALRGGADKSLDRPERKQATATKLGIYSTYPPRSSIHFLARCSNFCKPLKKKNQNVVRPTRSPRQPWPPRRAKNGNFQLFFQSREQVVVRRGQIRRIGWVIKTLEAQVGQFLLGCKCPASRGIVVQEQDHLGELPTAFFLQNVLQLLHQR